MMMMPSLDPVNSPSPSGDTGLSRSLRFELADEENRALLGSYAISTSLGIAFLLLQQFGPRSDTLLSLLPDPRPPIVFRYFGIAPEPTGIARTQRPGSAPRVTNADPTNAAGAINEAFRTRTASGTGTAPGDPAGLLRDVAVSTGSGNAGGVGGKMVLGFGEGGQGSTVPGRGGIGTGNAGGGEGIGGMAKNGGVGRSVVSVTGPAAIPVAPVARGRDVVGLGTYVRGREAELRFCYEENGLRLNPSLGGSITVAITIAGSGGIGGAEVTRRSWSGRGAAESEACILRAIRGWRLPASDRGPGTYSFPFSFTK